jgi:hypothetical protein
MVTSPRFSRISMAAKVRHEHVVAFRERGHVTLEDLAGACEAVQLLR